MHSQVADEKGMQVEQETPLHPPPPYSLTAPDLDVDGISAPTSPSTTSSSISWQPETPQTPTFQPESPQPSTFQPGTPRTSTFRDQNPQTVNYFLLSAKHKQNLSGTYLIDPLLPDVAGLSRKMRRKLDPVWGKSCDKSDIHASFEICHGSMDLNLAVVAHGSPQASSSPVPARITVNSKHTLMSVDVHEIHHGRSLDLHVESDHGKLLLLLPPTFDGLVVLKTDHTTTQFLPAFAARTRTVRASDRETVLTCSPLGPSSGKTFEELAEGEGDRCLIRSKHTKLFVGVSELDRPSQSSGTTATPLIKTFEEMSKST